MKTVPHAGPAVKQGWGPFRWLRALFGNEPAPRPSSAVAAKRAARTSAPAEPIAQLTFAHYAEAIGLEYQEPAPPSDDDLALIAKLAEDVQKHFADEQSGPASLPAASLRVLNLVARADIEVAELTRAVSQDPAITAAVLRVANSAALAPTSREIKTVRDAVSRLGVTEVGRVAGAIAARTLFNPKLKAEQALFADKAAELHATAATAASGAARLAMQRRRGRSDQAFLGGMLHDVGKSVALGSLAALAFADKAPKRIDPALLDAVLERVHVELGGEVHVEWSLPEYLTKICASHHDREVPEQTDFDEVHLVRVVSGLLQLRMRPQPLERVDELMQSLRALGIRPLELRALDSELKAMGDQMRAVLGVGGAARPQRAAV